MKRAFWFVAELALVVPISVALLGIGLFQVVTEQARRLS